MCGVESLVLLIVSRDAGAVSEARFVIAVIFWGYPQNVLPVFACNTSRIIVQPSNEFVNTIGFTWSKIFIGLLGTYMHP